MPGRSKDPQHDLFDVGPRSKAARIASFNRSRAIWTENKAKLIATYLYKFLMVTKHGTYIDGFAGPQEGEEDALNWSARLVLQLEPLWLRHFILIEQNPQRVEYIRHMVRSLKPTPLRQKHRDIKIISGDVNVELPKRLAEYPIKSTEATFCLLDQWTRECHWKTVETVARHKKGRRKIELFYFLANSWLSRTLKNTTKNVERVDLWWGDDGWRKLLTMSSYDRAWLMTDRLKSTFGYQFVTPHPIYNRVGGRRIMYFMIHASDHPAAPILMADAYSKAVEPLPEQGDTQLMINALPEEARSW
jgi:three-Cys-motif partner protein